MIKLWCILLLLSGDIWGKNFFDVSYADSSKEFSKYSVSYVRFISTDTVFGIGYAGYNNDKININSVRTSFELIKDNFSILLKPFYFLREGSFYYYGAKLGFNLIKNAQENSTTYGLFFSYSREKSLVSKNISIMSMLVEKNFYDEFFIMLGSSLGILSKGYIGYFDKYDVFNLGYFGSYVNVPHFALNINFARSFKPDFNSYLYTNFDFINSSIDLNSYVIGIRTYFNEKENYYLDFSFNIADFKIQSDEKIWKISFGGGF